MEWKTDGTEGVGGSGCVCYLCFDIMCRTWKVHEHCWPIAQLMYSSRPLLLIAKPTKLLMKFCTFNLFTGSCRQVPVQENPMQFVFQLHFPDLPRSA